MGRIVPALRLDRSTVLMVLVALVAGLVVAVVGEPNRTSEASVERPIVATDAVCFGLVVTDVAVAAPVRRLDPPSLFPAGVGWDVERGSIIDTAAGTFLIGWEADPGRSDIEVHFAVLRPSGRPFASGPAGGTRRFSAAARLGVTSVAARVEVVGGTNEAYLVVDDRAGGAVQVVRLVPDRITSTGVVDAEADVLSVAAGSPAGLVGAARQLWLAVPDPAVTGRFDLQVVVFGLADGPGAVAAAEQLASPHLVRVAGGVVGQRVDGTLARFEVDESGDGIAVSVGDSWPMPDGATGAVEAVSVRASQTPALLTARADGDVAIVRLSDRGAPAGVRVLSRPQGLGTVEGVLAVPGAVGVVGIADGTVGYWIGVDDVQPALTRVERPGDVCSVRNEPLARRILAPVARGDLLFLHYSDGQADCVIDVARGTDCRTVDRSAGGIPRPNLAAISELELPDVEEETDDDSPLPEVEEVEEVELDLVGESVTTDPCVIVDPARILTGGRPEITAIQAEGAGFSLAWWWNTTDDGCVPSSYEFVRVSGGACSAAWPTASSARLRIDVDVERTGFATTWDADPGERFAVFLRGLVDGQSAAVGNIDCREVRIPVATPPAPTSFQASTATAEGNWTLSWQFACLIAASCGGERFEVTMAFCSGSARQSFVTAERSLTIPIDDDLVGQVVQFSVLTLRDGDGDVLRSEAASAGCAESLRPARDGSPGGLSISAPAGGNLQVTFSGNARTELIRLLGTSQVDGLSVTVSRADVTASGAGGFDGGGGITAEMSTTLCFGDEWSVSLAAGGRSIAAGSARASCNVAATAAGLSVSGSGSSLTFVLSVAGLDSDVAAGATVTGLTVGCPGPGGSTASGGGQGLSVTMGAGGCFTTGGSFFAELTIAYPGDTARTIRAEAGAGDDVVAAMLEANFDELLAEILAELRPLEKNADEDSVSIRLSRGSFAMAAETIEACDPEAEEDHDSRIAVAISIGGLQRDADDVIVRCIFVPPPADEDDDADDGEGGGTDDDADDGEGGGTDDDADDGEGGGTDDDADDGEGGGT